MIRERLIPSFRVAAKHYELQFSDWLALEQSNPSHCVPAGIRASFYFVA